MVGAGIWQIDWHYSLIVNGSLLMLAGALAMRKGK